MTARLALAGDPAAYIRPSARVASVAAALDCNPGDVRRLLDQGELEAHGKGIRGIRIYLDSVRDYQDRQARPAKGARPAQVIHKSKAKAPASTAAFRAAMARLHAKGLA